MANGTRLVSYQLRGGGNTCSNFPQFFQVGSSLRQLQTEIHQVLESHSSCKDLRTYGMVDDVT